jgi:hypothetical protein
MVASNHKGGSPANRPMTRPANMEHWRARIGQPAAGVASFFVLRRNGDRITAALARRPIGVFLRLASAVRLKRLSARITVNALVQARICQ